MFSSKRKVGYKNINSDVDFKKCIIHSLNDYVFSVLNNILYIKFYIKDIKYRMKLNLNDDVIFNKDNKTMMFYYDDYIWNYNKKCSKKIQNYFKFNFINDETLFNKLYSHTQSIKILM